MGSPRLLWKLTLALAALTFGLCEWRPQQEHRSSLMSVRPAAEV